MWLFFHSCMYVTPIRLGLLSRSKTNQIVAYKVVSFERKFACFFFLFGPVGTDVAVSGALNSAALADNGFQTKPAPKSL